MNRRLMNLAVWRRSRYYGALCDNREEKGLTVHARSVAVLAVVFATFWVETSWAEIRLGLINDFGASDRPTGQSWNNNIGTGLPVGTGGPDGGAFLRIHSTGPQGNDPQCPGGTNNSPTECGSRLAINNESADWTGDYLRSGVRAVSLAVRNSGSRPAPLRLAFSKSRSSGGVWWISRNPIVLEPDNQWKTVVFSIEESALEKSPLGFPSNNSDIYTEAFAAIVIARILVNSELNHRGEQLEHQIDVDKITTLATAPEPVSLIFAHGFEAE